tara:strand:+ start:121 stop:1239 length:1119 start_codon:yes stop_codon:yes gene_type:complete
MRFFIDFLKSWIHFFKIKNLKKNKKQIVFYAEQGADWVFLEPVIKKLKQKNINLIKITSDAKDEYLNNHDVFFIGSGTARTILFRTINSKGFVMTLTDLDSLQLKKSIFPVHYFYLFHSMASTHRVYREHAFNAYDTIFCTGKYQIDEILETENKYNIKNKILIKQGYVRLDELMNRKLKFKNNQKNIIIAPTWGNSSLIPNHLDNLINLLITENYFVTLRLHPMTLRHRPKLKNKIEKKFNKTGKFIFDSDLKNEISIIKNDIMISEWSGAALEFAFANERPVIFIDTKTKINNPNWKKINKSCFEEYIRKDIGIVVSENNLAEIPNIIKKLLKEKKIWSKRIAKIRNENIFNIGKSIQIAANSIIKTLEL